MSSQFFDALETRTAEAREADQLNKLKQQIALASSKTAWFSKTLVDIDPDKITSLDDLAQLPIVRKSELLQAQDETDPFGGMITKPVGELRRVYMSPGPISDPEGHDQDWWRLGRALTAAGFKAGDVVLNCFSYHHTPAGHMFETAAHAVGCAVYPGGIGQTEAQVAAISRYKIDGYVGTPDFLKIILEKADKLGVDVSSLKKACVSGGPLFPQLRAFYEERGIRVTQCLGTADLGLVAYETLAGEGMVVEENVILEIVTPGTGDPVKPGDVGEIIVTLLTNTDYPLIRFATGDMTALLAGDSPCGRTNMRIKGWMGRADQRTKIKGMFVDPAQIAKIVKAFDKVKHIRVEVDLDSGKDIMRVHVETVDENSATEQLKAELDEAIRIETKLKGEVIFAQPDSLARDGKIIDDLRSYEN